MRTLSQQHPTQLTADAVAYACEEDASLRVFQARAITRAESAAGLVKVVGGLTREGDGGAFGNYEEGRLAW